MDVTAFTVSKHLSDLVGRQVAVKVVGAAEFSSTTRVACYAVEPNHGTAVVQLDFHLLATLAGMMIGIPQVEIDSQIRSGELDENLTDASRELMNVLSAVVVSEGRAIFKGLFIRSADYSGAAQDLLRGGFSPLKLTVTPAGAKAGCMLLTSDSV